LDDLRDSRSLSAVFGAFGASIFFTKYLALLGDIPGQTSFVQSLQMAFGAMPFSADLLDTCSRNGWIISSTSDGQFVNPVMSSLILWTVAYKLKSAFLPPTLSCLLPLITEFLSLDDQDGYSGKKFEHQFFAMWRLRSYASLIDADHPLRIVDRTVSWSLNAMIESLSREARSPVLTTITRPGIFKRVFSKSRPVVTDVILRFPASYTYMKVEDTEWDTLVLIPNGMYVAANNSNPGFEGFLTLSIEDDPTNLMLVIIENKYSGASGDHEAKLTNVTLNEKLDKTFSHRFFGKTIKSYHKRNRVCFLLAGFRDKTPHLGETDRTKLTGPSRITLKSEYAGIVAVMGRSAILAFLTPTFMKRP
jgi:hypothetical protein